MNAAENYTSATSQRDLAAGVLKQGAQVGSGLAIPVSKGISLMPGVALHSVSAPQPQIGRLYWWDAYLGFEFRVLK